MTRRMLYLQLYFMQKGIRHQGVTAQSVLLYFEKALNAVILLSPIHQCESAPRTH